MNIVRTIITYGEFHPPIELSFVENPPVDIDDIAWHRLSNISIGPIHSKKNSNTVSRKYIPHSPFAVSFYISIDHGVRLEIEMWL